MRKAVTSIVALGAWLAAAAPVRADEELPDDLKDIAIVERPGSQVPLDAELTDQQGRTVHVRDYLADGKPLILALAYYRCPMLCTLVLNGMVDGMRDLAWTAGDQYRVLVVSINPRETSELAREKRENYLRTYGRIVPDRAFEFAVGTEEQVRRLADAVGFRYRWDEKNQQYAHAAGLFVLTPDGRLSQTMYGISFPSNDLRLALVQATAGKLGTAWDQVVLFCYHYDPSSRGYVLAATRVMRAGGVAVLLLLGVVLGTFWRRERRRGMSEGRAA